MTANYFTLATLTREIATALAGSTFEEAYSHRPNELRLRFDRGTLVAVLRPMIGALFLSTTGEQRPKTNIQLFFQELAGQRLSGIEISPVDREVVLGFGVLSLRLSFYGSPNAVLSDNTGAVIGAFKKHSVAAVEPNHDASGQRGSRLGKRYLREAATRGVSEEALEDELLNASGAIVYDLRDSVLLSLIPLHSLGDAPQARHFDSINEATRYTIVERGKRERVAGLRRELTADVEREIERLERSRSEMRRGAEDSNRPERHATFGNALLMHAQEIERGSDQIELEVEEQRVVIPLDPTLSAHENAARYFERAKRARQSREELKLRAITSGDELRKLQERQNSILAAETLDELLALKKTRTPKQSADEGPRFRAYTVFGGMTVLVGKNAKQNDELTLHTAKKEDVWLHARGVPGSHVVLQTGGRKQVPKEAIVQAAEIAAYHSDARTQKVAPVAYTQKKYVRKPKGAAPGAVVIEREEVVMVTPRIPTP